MCDVHITSRSSFESKFSKLVSGKFKWRLFDFAPEASLNATIDSNPKVVQQGSDSASPSGLKSEQEGLAGPRAIVRVDLKDYDILRKLVDPHAKEAKNTPFFSYTASGKIALVRKRMGLRKPQRKR